MRTILLAGLFATVAGVAYGTYTALSKFETPWKSSADVAATTGEGASAVEMEHPPKVVVLAGEGEESGDFYDFNVMERGEAGEHVFRLRNDGESVLTLKLGKASCTCTSSDLTKDRLEPGEEAEVTVTWDTSERNSGPLSVAAPVHTNDPMRPTVQLRVQGSIATTFQAQPQDFMLGEVREGDSKEATIRLYGFKKEPLDVVSFEFTDPETADQFELTWETAPAASVEELEARSGLILKLKTTGKLPIGLIQQKVRINTSYEIDPVQIDLVGTVVGDLRITSPDFNDNTQELRLGNLRASQGAKKRLFVLIGGPHREETTVTIGEVEPAYLKAELGEPVEVGRLTRIPLTVEVPAGSPAESHLGGVGGKLGRIVLETTHPVYGDVEIGVKYMTLAD